MFREFNTLELTFCVEFTIFLLLEPPSLHVLLPNSPSLTSPPHTFPTMITVMITIIMMITMITFVINMIAMNTIMITMDSMMIIMIAMMITLIAARTVSYTHLTLPTKRIV